MNIDACREFIFEFPPLGPETLKLLTPPREEEPGIQQNTSKTLPKINWIGVVQRGGCPFDTKVLNMQNAGFHTTLIFNSQNQIEQTIRMSAHTLVPSITTFSAFLNREDGLELSALLLQEKPGTSVYEIRRGENSWFSKELLMSGLIDVLVLFALVVVTGTTFITFGLMLNLLHNIYQTGHPNTLQTLQQASILILSGQKTTNPPKLSRITFPKRFITQVNMMTNWKNSDCKGGIKGYESCPICIEEFTVGASVRDLPCMHVFHTEWYLIVI